MVLRLLVVNKSDSGQRKYPRYRVHCRVTIVRENGGKSELFHGRTHDLSIDGASVYSDNNILIKEPVNILLATPSYNADQDETIIEIHCRMLYTVLLHNHHQFRIGLHFLRFKDNGRKLLEGYLSDRTPLASHSDSSTHRYNLK